MCDLSYSYSLFFVVVFFFNIMEPVISNFDRFSHFLKNLFPRFLEIEIAASVFHGVGRTSSHASMLS